MANGASELVRYRSLLPDYRAGSDGSVWSRLSKRGPLGARMSAITASWRRLEGTPDKDGYLRVEIAGRHHFIHCLVLLAFVGPRPAGCPHTRHLDGDRTNNRIDNLTWGTAQENYEDRVRHGTARRRAEV